VTNVEGLESPDPGIELLGIEDIGIAALDAMVVQYSILELNTAIKPFVFSRLFADAAASGSSTSTPTSSSLAAGARC
jgi:hypothetical protein